METTPFQGEEHRRSHRVPYSARVFVLSLDPTLIFAGHCETTEVNSHGCEIHASRPFDNGAWLCLGNLPGNHVATARVVHSVVTDPVQKTYSYETESAQKYRVGLELDTPGNVWGIEWPPMDWSHGK